MGYSIDSRMRSALAVAALQAAISRRHLSGAVVHSDRGSQFRSKEFVRALSDAGLLGSMGRAGVCGQRGDGVLLRPAAEERPESAPVGEQGSTPPRHRALDRGHLPPETW
ncbi:DDE-type integrase/transposase/recombinase [Curtobacterium flaccumfaciens pv. flaccumfaciens]|nr:DDE-type integrase/transposase/recombinase [Curtobacterium flaccumfaciens pv. flaccumfaciens]